MCLYEAKIPGVTEFINRLICAIFNLMQTYYSVHVMSIVKLQCKPNNIDLTGLQIGTLWVNCESVMLD